MSEDLKRCIDCRRRKSIEDFYRVYAGREYRQARCKPCDNRRRAGKRAGLSDTVVEVVRNEDGTLRTFKRARDVRG